MPLTNTVTIAAAGSGKSTSIVADALSQVGRRTLITTFTVEGTEELRKIVSDSHGTIPKSVDVMTWMAFLIQECIRPYQTLPFGRTVSRPIFVQGRSTQGIAKKRPEYFFATEDGIYSDKLAEYAVLCNEISGGKVISRLKSIFDLIYIDEFQDFAGYDFELVEAILRSGVALKIVADPRQGTFSTNESAKNSKYKKAGVQLLVEKWEAQKLCEIVLQNWSYRCNQAICNLADSLYPEFEATVSRNTDLTGHDGVFVVRSADLDGYLESYVPMILRYSAKTAWKNERVRNFGAVKGRTYPRVLILPNGPVGDFLSGKALSSPAKYYVALTRARYSVAILYDGPVKLAGIEIWKK